MWQLENKTAFKAERAWVRDLHGAEVWLIAVKGVFKIRQDGLELAEEQEAVNLTPVFDNPDDPKNLLADTDLPHQKLATDVLVEGAAFTPGGRPARALDVTLTVDGHFSKTLRVFGNRTWQRRNWSFSLTEPEPFTQMPLTWEKAFGGTCTAKANKDKPVWEPRNPLGCGFATCAEQVDGMPAPNIELPSAPITYWDDRPAPAGFAPIPGHWAPRLRYAGTYDQAWEQQRQPLLPLDFNPRFYQSAPEDQQIDGFLRGGERIECVNMGPEPVRFRVPRVSLVVSTEFAAGRKVVRHPVIHTVIVRPDRKEVVVVWHSDLPCHADTFSLKKSIVREKTRVKITKEGLVADGGY